MFALAQAMKKLGFLETITAGDGRVYKLPAGDYFGSGEFSADNLRKLVETAAAQTGKPYTIVVSAFTEMAWTGLEQVITKK